MDAEANILNSIQEKDITEMKSMLNPPADVKFILELLMIAFEKSTDWKHIVTCINKPTFIDMIN